ncbi:hypothetical protein N658DRAFT_60863 [Parathielavia hyrcaniae]|uniref:Uncharacterized protein n=1 Tax=Parathielavia hyrcaniae TaxID=113614 RepID=A0AAN6T234_9PEZI|nr:hypothetical protein N658DRAFT_60863 [Parathielavia hyrcaniae]
MKAAVCSKPVDAGFHIEASDPFPSERPPDERLLRLVGSLLLRAGKTGNTKSCAEETMSQMGTTMALYVSDGLFLRHVSARSAADGVRRAGDKTEVVRRLMNPTGEFSCPNSETIDSDPFGFSGVDALSKVRSFFADLPLPDVAEPESRWSRRRKPRVQYTGNCDEILTDQ